MKTKIQIFKRAPETPGLRVAGFYVHAGFESPGTDYEEERICLNAYVTKHPEATFYFKIKGECMKNSGIYEDDLMVLDRSLIPVSGDIIVASLNGGEFLIACYLEFEGCRYLMCDHHDIKKYKPVYINNDDELKLEGVVPFSVLNQRRQRNVRINRLQQLLRQLRAGISTPVTRQGRRSA